MKEVMAFAQGQQTARAQLGAESVLICLKTTVFNLEDMVVI